jgi:hypothetical protein
MTQHNPRVLPPTIVPPGTLLTLVILPALLVVRSRLAQEGAESVQNQFRSLLGDPVTNAVDRLDPTV